MQTHPDLTARSRSLIAVVTAIVVAFSGAVLALVAPAAPAAADPVTVLASDFEGADPAPWTGRGATVSLDADAHTGAQALLVTGRTAGWNGAQVDVSTLFTEGEYHVTGWVKLAAGQEPTQVNFGVNQPGAENEYPWVGARVAVTDSAWVQLDGYYTVDPATPPTVLYLESASATADLLLDDVVITTEERTWDPTLTPLKDTLDVPVGVAIDSRETTGPASELLLHHFDQITAENHMKVEAWYDGTTFRRHPEATALLDFAVVNDLSLYGHVLLWHSQTPDWFFQREDGTPLTSSEADKQLLRDRLRTHVFDVAASIAADYGPFGSPGNPLTGIDVVNEVVSDANEPGDGLRRSAWYAVLGEEFIPLAFQYADEAFNSQYAAEGSDRPVTLFINDYNTEQAGKQDRYYALVERLLAAGVPVDGVGHQFHASLSTPTASFDTALTRFSALPVVQAVTELDATVGTPVTEANLIAQGHWYRDAFEVFRAHADDLFSVTVWGLTDARSWRSEQAPLLFDGALQAKYAYFGAIGDDDGVPPLATAANVFGGDVALDATAGDAVAWRNLPPQQLSEGAGSFIPRWTADHLTLLVDVAADSSDAVEITYEGATYAVTTAGETTGGASAVVIDDDGDGWRAVLHVPHTDVAIGDEAELDVRVIGAGAVVGAWNEPGETGTLTFLEDLSTVEVVEAVDGEPTIDGVVDDVWASANVVHTDTTVEGAADGASADVRTLWAGDDTLYVLMEVTDPVIDVSSGDPWVQDSVELFLDLGNDKSGSYGSNDSQMRVSVDNVTSFGTGDAAEQAARLTSATARTEAGYVVELAVLLRGESGGQDDVALGGADTFQGLDFQVNDGREGSRYSVHTWAEPTGTGYQTTARWGVGHLVAAPAPTYPEFDPGTVYLDGDRVSYEGAVYEAQWWTRGTLPDASPWGSWMRVGEEVDTPQGVLLTWTDSWVYSGGELVVHDGRIWQARWWSRNHEPGDRWGPWVEVATV